MAAAPKSSTETSDSFIQLVPHAKPELAESAHLHTMMADVMRKCLQRIDLETTPNSFCKVSIKNKGVFFVFSTNKNVETSKKGWADEPPKNQPDIVDRDIIYAKKDPIDGNITFMLTVLKTIKYIEDTKENKRWTTTSVTWTYGLRGIGLTQKDLVVECDPSLESELQAKNNKVHAIKTSDDDEKEKEGQPGLALAPKK